MKITKYILTIAAALSLSMTFASCEEGKSYSDLLREEEKATNWYMANQKIELELPEDNNFITGTDAPFYKLDEDGYIYMQVVNAGDPDMKAEKGDAVYFRFVRQNLKYMYQGIDAPKEGNGDDMDSSLGATKFIYDEPTYVGSMAYGTGIQMPLKYLGYNSEVNLVMRSYYGFQTDQSQCLPYIYNVKYFRAEY